MEECEEITWTARGDSQLEQFEDVVGDPGIHHCKSYVDGQKIKKGDVFSRVILILDLRVDESRNDQFDQNETCEGQEEQPRKMALLVCASGSGERKHSQGNHDTHYYEAKLNFEQNAVLVVNSWLKTG